MLKRYLQESLKGKTLTEAEAEQVMNEIMSGVATPSQIASLLSILRFRGETVEELTGFAKTMRTYMETVTTSFEDECIDTCGTGGDGVSSFNISTAAAIVASSIGIKVAKHGNRAVSSKSGSADVLEYLGIPIQSTIEEVHQSLESHSMSFLFAPIYHTAMKHAVIPRSELGFRTVFNLLGPLANPTLCKKQVIGVYDTSFAVDMAETLKELGSKHVLLVTGRDGLDELSVTTYTDVVELRNGNITRFTIHPHDVGLSIGNLQDIQTNTVEESGSLILKIFKGKANESARNTVLFNAGAAIYVAGRANSIKEGVEIARQAIDSLTVLNHFKSLVNSRKEHRYA
ncbi:anthranilate phosphoribosyltransferase [Bacillus sp. BGMRC 2118]|nr:anthranilate phosphoribosyltransferase [Bacillus sp. BGMRC 2118]